MQCPINKIKKLECDKIRKENNFSEQEIVTNMADINNRLKHQ